MIEGSRVIQNTFLDLVYSELDSHYKYKMDLTPEFVNMSPLLEKINCETHD